MGMHLTPHFHLQLNTRHLHLQKCTSPQQSLLAYSTYMPAPLLQNKEEEGYLALELQFLRMYKYVCLRVDIGIVVICYASGIV